MHTVLVILEGLLLYGLCHLAAVLATTEGTAGRDRATQLAARVFIGLWLVCAFFNLWRGVTKAHDSVVDELPIFVAVFAIPAGLAAWRIHRTLRKALPPETAA